MFRKLKAEKALQAIGVLLDGERGQIMSRLRILKLLYIAEREVLKETGRTLLGGRIVAMDHGPLHSDVLDLTRGRHIDEPLFSEVFQKFGYWVEMKRSPGVAELSEYEIAKLQEVAERYVGIDDWSLAHEVTHKFKEWIDHYQESTSKDIPPEAILDAVDRAEDKEAILKEDREQASFDRLFDPSFVP